MPFQNSYNKTLIAGTKVALGSDATGDLYYLNAGVLTRLPIGINGQMLTVSGGIPAWVTGASPGGNAGGDLAGTYPNPTIANNAVSFAKFQNISTGVFLGRNTAGTGLVEEVSPTTARTLLGLGTAALVNTGTGSGNVPVLDGSGLLSTSVIPPLRSHEFVQVANATARLALTTSQVQPGDEAFQQDTTETYKLIATDPSVSGNWVLIADRTLDASAIVSGTIATARLGSGTANSSTYLRGDQTWATIPPSKDPWTEVTATSQALVANNRYAANNAAQVTLTLPTTAALGDQIEIIGKGAGGWRVAQNASQQIRFGDLSTTAGISGRLDSSNRYDSICLVCITANTEWSVIRSQGNIDVV